MFAMKIAVFTLLAVTSAFSPDQNCVTDDCNSDTDDPSLLQTTASAVGELYVKSNKDTIAKRKGDKTAEQKDKKENNGDRDDELAYQAQSPGRFKCKGDTYMCSSQEEAGQHCQSSGLSLCNKQDIKDQIGDVCAWMWTSSSSTHGFFIGNGGSGCGVKGRLESSTTSYKGAGRFDAACCRQALTFNIGDRVTWIHSDSDVPSGTVGDVIGIDGSRSSGNTVEVQFPGGSWWFKPAELKEALGDDTDRDSDTLSMPRYFTDEEACQSTDNGATDSSRHNCADYAKSTRWCGKHDDLDFQAKSMCCACGGGMQVSCKDKRSENWCKRAKRWGDCRRHKENPYCKKTCGKCSAVWYQLQASCKDFEDENYCSRSKRFGSCRSSGVIYVCKKTCGKCISLDQVVGISDDAPPERDDAPPEPNLFVELDTNKDKKLSEDEIRAHFKKVGEEDMSIPEGLFAEEDKDKDGSVSWDEFSGPKGDAAPTYED